MTEQPSAEGTDTESETRHDRQVEVGMDSRGHDRQVLVVGDTPTAVATAGFLEQAGLDPVLAPRSSQQALSTVVTLWRPGLVLLERLGLRRPVEGIGQRLDRLDRPSTGSSWTTEPAARPSLLAIRRSEFESLLDRRIRDRVRTVDRPVTGIDTTRARVEATFEGGIEESFDTVVTATAALGPAFDSGQDAAPLHTWEFDWPGGTDTPAAVTERWAQDVAAFSVRVGDDTHLRLVSAAEPTHAPTDMDTLERQFASLFDSPADPFRDLSQHAVRYNRYPRVAPASVYTDGIVLVGPAGRASVPGDCLRTTLGIEDAWVLADALAYGPPDRDDALETHEQRRRRRERELQAHSLPGCPATRVPDGLSPFLSSLHASRTLAFQHAVAGQLPDVARGVPESL